MGLISDCAMLKLPSESNLPRLITVPSFKWVTDHRQLDLEIPEECISVLQLNTTKSFSANELVCSKFDYIKWLRFFTYIYSRVLVGF